MAVVGVGRNNITYRVYYNFELSPDSDETSCIRYKDHSILSVYGKNRFFSEYHTKSSKILCRKCKFIVNVKAGRPYSYDCDLKD